jgi:ribosomal protein S18 acetylase RimI-like enzyme
MDVTIRHYQPSDQQPVLKISADTAFFGDPVEAFLEDRQLYMDAFARYYIENDVQYAWIAENPDGVIGFLLGCVDTAVQVKKWRAYIIRIVLLRAIAGKYKLGKKTVRFSFAMLVGSLKGEGVRVDFTKYPAHLQIDIKQGFRGAGVGNRLIQAYLEQLRNLDVGGVHLETTSHNEIAWHLYEKVGFEILDEKPNRFWTKMLGFEVTNRSYGLKL